MIASRPERISTVLTLANLSSYASEFSMPGLSWLGVVEQEGDSKNAYGRIPSCGQRDSVVGWNGCNVFGRDLSEHSPYANPSRSRITATRWVKYLTRSALIVLRSNRVFLLASAPLAIFSPWARFTTHALSLTDVIFAVGTIGRHLRPMHSYGLQYRSPHGYYSYLASCAADPAA